MYNRNYLLCAAFSATIHSEGLLRNAACTSTERIKYILFF